MQRYSTPAIVLRTRPLREADLLLTCLTPELGKLTGVASHARRSQRRFGGALEMGTIGIVAYTERLGDTLVRIESMQVAWSPLGQCAHLPVFAAMGVLLDSVDAMTVERQVAPEKFRLVCDTLTGLSVDPVGVLVCGLVRWLDLVGVAPDLARCVVCGRAVEDDTPVVRFVPQEGGIQCGVCRRGTPWSVAFDRADRAAWRACAAGEGVREFSAAFRDGLWRSLQHATGRVLRSDRYWEMLWNDSV